ncbi:hypothetical protein AAVH_32330 [Aphelenchoides avenae]|nr:hypothetical protein AAVH_32330 [Aphelenchus avenae]
MFATVPSTILSIIAFTSLCKALPVVGPRGQVYHIAVQGHLICGSLDGDKYAQEPAPPTDIRLFAKTKDFDPTTDAHFTGFDDVLAVSSNKNGHFKVDGSYRTWTPTETLHFGLAVQNSCANSEEPITVDIPDEFIYREGEEKKVFVWESDLNNLELKLRL